MIIEKVSTNSNIVSWVYNNLRYEVNIEKAF